MTHLCVGTIGSDTGLSPDRGQAIIWTNAGLIVIWIRRNKLQWNFHRNSYIFFQRNVFEKVYGKTVAILSRPQCVKTCCYQYSLWRCINHLKRSPNLINHDHDDVIKWNHFPRHWPFFRGIHRSPVNSPHKGQWHRAVMFSLIYARINWWLNNGDAGDLRRHRAHYDVIVMVIQIQTINTKMMIISSEHFLQGKHATLRGYPAEMVLRFLIGDKTVLPYIMAWHLQINL